MLSSTKAIVLNSLKFQDERIIVNLLTEDYGRISSIIKISSSAKAKLKRQYFQPLFLLEIILDYRQASNFQKIKEAKLLTPLSSIPFDPYKLSISLFISEFLNCATRREQADDVLFSYIKNSILYLDGLREGFSNFHLVFMMRLTKFLGFYPNIDNFIKGDWFDLRSSCFTHEVPLHDDYLPPEEAEKISLILRMDFPTMHLYRISQRERLRLIDLIISYYRLHVNGFLELKSLKVMKELFS